MRDSFNAGPVETVLASATVGTAVVVAAGFILTGVVPGALAIGALLGASIVFGIADYYIF